MGILKRRLNYNNAGSEDILHLETSSDMVKRADGSDLETAMAAAEASLQTLTGTGEGSLTKAVADAVARIVADAPEDLNDFRELADWISSHETDAAAMNSAIKALQTSVSTLSASASKIKEITFTAANFTSGVYTIPAATHGMPSGAFLCTVYALNGTVYETGTWATTEVKVAYNADASISIHSSSGFAGKIVLIG